MGTHNAIQPPVGTIPNSARGEVFLPIVEGEKPFPVRFSLRALHDYTTRTGHKLTDLGQLLTDDFSGTVGELVTSAVRCCVPGTVAPPNFQVGDALDLIERLGAEETTALVDAVMDAIRVDKNPLFQALLAKSQALAAQQTNGANTSTSPLAN